MPAFDLLDFNWNVTPSRHIGNGDPFRYLWYRKKTHAIDETTTTLHTTVEVGVDGYYVGEFDPTLTLVQYSSAKDTYGQTIEDSIQLNVASSDDEGDVATLDALFGDTWRDFLTKVAHAAQERHALAVSRGELVAPAVGGDGEGYAAAMLTSALELSKVAASPDHDEYDDALGGLFGEFEGEPADVDEWEIDPNGGLELRDYTNNTDAIRPGVSRRLSLDVQSDNVYVEDTPTEVMQAAVLPEPEDVESDDTDPVATAADDTEAIEFTGGTADNGTDGNDPDVKDDALPADLQAVLDKYGPDVLAKLLNK